ncbi:hypothetical protein ONA91_01360 [Micromonospora sp. DR5-3]|uniref:hypothetical protein n=1 Tax=unclassified Micromonospora TaxID=2617518 RepID=UPI001651B859|nr:MULTISPECIES: hypothetical protein [unclassified Micromonospora]MCW3813107.1 hypothetical protein [Micromonospora sp. DR5-3]
MPAPVAPAEKRSPSLLTVLFWIGVGLAPLAALTLLVAGGDGSLRVGAVLAILAVVLIGLSIALRPDNSGDVAGSEAMREEIEQLRRELRSEIVAAAQRGNQALDQAHRTQETVIALRRRLDATAAAAAGISVAAAEEPAGGRARVPSGETYDDGRVRYAATEQPGWGQPAGRDEDEPAGRPQSGTRAERPAPPTDRPQPGVYGAPRTQEPDARPEPRPVGVVHHTETVHVTTRHTIVDGAADQVAGGRYAGRWSPAPEERPWSGAEPEERPRSGHREVADDPARSSGDRWGGHGEGRDGAAWSGPGGPRDGAAWSGPGGERNHGAAPSWEDGSWSGTPAPEQRWAARAGGAGASADDRGWPAGGDDRTGSTEPAGPGDQRSWPASQAGPPGQRSWSAGRDGDDRSWATGREGGRAEQSWSAPQDERYWADPAVGRPSPDGRAGAPPAPSGRAAASDDPDGEYWSELRAGNRWASVRDDEHGREVRVGERHAAVHADGAGSEYRVEDRWASVREPNRGHAAGAGAGWVEGNRPALPVGGVPVPDEWRPPTQRSGQPEWRQAEPEPARYGYPPRDETPRAGDPRSADRWR